MFNISKKSSLNISIILSFVFFAVIIASAFILPAFVDNCMAFPSKRLENSTETDLNTILILGYVALATVAVANVLLVRLLFRVKAGLVFTDTSTGLIRGVSWCAILLGIVFLFLGGYFLLSYFASFACIFLGLCLRVVKSVIQHASEIKAENDFTV